MNNCVRSQKGNNSASSVKNFMDVVKESNNNPNNALKLMVRYKIKDQHNISTQISIYPYIKHIYARFYSLINQIYVSFDNFRTSK